MQTFFSLNLLPTQNISILKEPTDFNNSFDFKKVDKGT